MIVSIRKAFPGHAQKVMHALWGLGMLSLSKSIVVVDEHVDVHDYADVFFRVTANVDPKRDVLITEGPLDHLDHAPGRQFYGGKLGIDATHKLPEEDARPVARGDRHERRDPRPRSRRRWDGLRHHLRHASSAKCRIRRVATVVTSLTGAAAERLNPRQVVLSESGHDTPHLPGPSLWPIGFAVGVACLLLGLVISWIVAAIGAVLAVVFGLLWARDVTRDVRGEVPEIEPETRAVADVAAASTSARAAEARSPRTRAPASSRRRRSGSARRSARSSRCPCSASWSSRRSRTSRRTRSTSGRSRTSRRAST